MDSVQTPMNGFPVYMLITSTFSLFLRLVMSRRNRSFQKSHAASKRRCLEIKCDDENEGSELEAENSLSLTVSEPILEPALVLSESPSPGEDGVVRISLDSFNAISEKLGLAPFDFLYIHRNRLIVVPASYWLTDRQHVDCLCQWCKVINTEGTYPVGKLN